MSTYLVNRSLKPLLDVCWLMAASIYYARENHKTIFLFKDIAFAVRAKLNSFKGFKRSLKAEGIAATWGLDDAI